MGVSWTSPGNQMYSYTWLSGSLPTDMKIDDVTVLYEDKKHVFQLNIGTSDKKPTLRLVCLPVFTCMYRNLVCACSTCPAIIVLPPCIHPLCGLTISMLYQIYLYNSMV